MVLLVAQHQGPPGQELREVQGVGGEPHPDGDGVLAADELGSRPLQLVVNPLRPELSPGAARVQATGIGGLNHIVRPFSCRAGGVAKL